MSGQNATDHDLLPELRRAKEARMKLKHAILAIQLQKRIARLKTEDSDSDDLGDLDQAAPPGGEAGVAGSSSAGEKKTTLREKLGGAAVFREVVLAKVREEKAKKDSLLQTDEELVQEARRKSFNATK